MGREITGAHRFPPGFFDRADPGSDDAFYACRASSPTSTTARSPPSVRSTTSWVSTVTCSIS